MSETAEKLAGAIVGSFKKRLGDFLGENPDALAFLEERALRMAELSIRYAIAPPQDRPALESEMEAVQLAMATESMNVALDADEASRAFFRDTVDVVFGFVKSLAKEAFPFLLQGLKFL